MDEKQEDEKLTVSARLSTEARELLTALAKKQGISKTAVLELAIREYAEKRGLLQ